MKKLLTFLFFICLASQVFAQTDGITYQAVIIGPDALELPGVDSEGNYLPNATVTIRFTIYDSANQIEFQETQTTDTDEFGRINLLIGEAEPDYFKSISWDGTPKDLKVEIDFEAGSSFAEMSREILTFLPFAYHRNITATGTLSVDGRTFLNDELQVEGPTNLNSSLDVNNGNATNLSGSLTVEGETNVNDALNINNGSPSNLTGDLSVSGNSLLDGTLDVIGLTSLNDLQVSGEAVFDDLQAQRLTVNQSTNLSGPTNISGSTYIDGLGNQVRITSSIINTNGDYAQIGNHPLLIEGGTNGLAIRVNGSRSNNTNFITFYDTTTTIPWGRIEGEIPSEFTNNADYNFDQTSLEFDIYDSQVDLGFAIAYEVIAAAQLIKSSSDFRGCFGLGGCVAAPGPLDIAFSVVELISATAQAIFATLVWDRSLYNKTVYDNNKLNFQGVTYASGSGDYAEYLQRKDLNEKMSFGDIVALNGGEITKNTTYAERMMVVSFKPIVLGNMPQKNHEHEYEKVAFMGQVPVKVFGKVNIGDYIIPSGKHDGTGIAIAASEVSIKDINNIVGIAWSKSKNAIEFNMINVAVGLNRNDNNPIVEKLKNRIEKQAIEVNTLKNQIAEIYEILSKLEDGHLSELKTEVVVNDNEEELYINNNDDRNYELIKEDNGQTIYWEITREDLEAGLNLAKEQMILNGTDVNNHFLWKRINSDPKFKEEILDLIQSKLDKQFHFHKSVKKQGKH